MPPSNPLASRAPRAALLACVVATAVTVGLTAVPAGAAKKPKAVVTITPGDVSVYKVGTAPDTIPDDVRNGVISALTGYVNAATVKPLQKAKGRAKDAALAAALAPAVAARLAGTDRAVLVDEGLPKAVSKIVVTTAPVALTGLADGDGKVVVVTANVDTTTTTKTTKGKLSIKRTGELVFEPDNGAWKISGYNLTVDRTGKAIKTPTTTAPAAPVAPTATTAAR